MFRGLEQGPTQTELTRILADLQQHVRTVEHLRTSLYGWMENLDRDRLYAAPLKPALEAVLLELDRLVGVEEIEIAAPAP